MSKDDPVQAVVDAITAATATPNEETPTTETAQTPKAPLTPYEQEVERDHRKQRFWIVRTLVLCIVFMTAMMTTSIAYVYAVQGGKFEGTAIEAIFSNISELIKLFNTP
jgi:hypothetical protein